MSKLILVLRGQTLKPGYLNASPTFNLAELSAQGVLAAKNAGLVLAQYSKEQTALGQVALNIGAVHSSSTHRARDTAHYLTSSYNEHFPLDASIEKLKPLSPRGYGEMDGWKRKEAQQQDPATFDKWFDTPDSAPLMGGETLRELRVRVALYLSTILVPLLDQKLDVLVVSHRQVISALVYHIEGQSDVWAPLNIAECDPIVMGYDPTLGKFSGRVSLIIPWASSPQP